jgi:hypothetical protein
MCIQLEWDVLACSIGTAAKGGACLQVTACRFASTMYARVDHHHSLPFPPAYCGRTLSNALRDTGDTIAACPLALEAVEAATAAANQA